MEKFCLVLTRKNYLVVGLQYLANAQHGYSQQQ